MTAPTASCGFEACAALSLLDADATVGVRVAVTPWTGTDTSIGWVVHPAGSRPSRPAWETYQLVASADSLALHPPSIGGHFGPAYWDDNDITLSVAGVVQDLVQMLLWERGSDPTWPPCPTHPGGHPLRLDREILWGETGDEPVIAVDSGAQWSCPATELRIRVGSLAELLGRASDC